MRIAVVILNWNTRSYLQAFLPAVLRSCAALGTDPSDGKPRAEAVVADSGSTDGSDALMAAEFPQVRFLPLGANFGFTGGYNRALSTLEGFDAYVLLNSDILVEDGWLKPLCSWMETHPDCGICGPKLHALERDGETWLKTGRFEYAGAAGGLLDRFGYPFCRGRVPGRMDEDRGQFDTPREVLWITGACLMVRRQVWEGLGGLDDRFFAHMEEIDLCWRAWHAGWKVCVVPEATVWHLGGGTLPADSPLKLELNYRNNLLLIENNLPAELLARGVEPRAARRRSALALWLRMVLDGCSALVYLLCGQVKKFQAVRSAHRRFRQLRRGPGAPLPQHPLPARGLMPLCIITLTACKGKRIFKYLEQYEDYH